MTAYQLTKEQLRLACITADLEFDQNLRDPGWVAHRHYRRASDGSRVCPIYHEDDPALLPYVASLLVDKIREGEDYGRKYHKAICRIAAPESYLVCATDEDRIQAAMEVLL